MLASSYAAIYPYYVWHDAVIQENAVLALIVAAAMFLLIRANQTPSRWRWTGAGAMLALAVLTKANLALMAPLCLVWIAVSAPGAPARRLQQALWAAVGIALVLGPWIVRTWRITGAPIIYSNGGYSLWLSNHRLTFDYFPRQSIDIAAAAERDDLSPAEQREYDAIDDPQGIRQTEWFWRKGVAFIRSHPALTLRRALYKVWIAFSPVFSPAKGAAFQTVYFVSFIPLFVLSPVGMWRARPQWRDTGYIYLLILAFAAGCAVFWGHTSHRMYIEPYLMIFAAFALTGLIQGLIPPDTPLGLIRRGEPRALRNPA
jgi:4-amino-4-deoxy-L-arabinose transferase-like glycosyltransferase